MREHLQHWFMSHRPDEKYFACKAAENQIMFVRDTLMQLVSIGLNYDHRVEPYVISTHTSKSVLLPVYEFHREDLGVRITLRDNFFNWMVSVESKHDVDIDTTELCNMYAEINPVYCEGFPRDRVFTSYAKRKVFERAVERGCKFTVELSNNYAVYAFLLLVMRSFYSPTGRFIERV